MVDVKALLSAAATAAATSKPAPSMKDFDDGIYKNDTASNISKSCYRYEDETVTLKGYVIHKIRIFDADNKMLCIKYYMELDNAWCSVKEELVDNSNKKYVVTSETIEYDGHILHRIKMLDTYRDPRYPNIQGGWIESEDNLSQFGICFVYDDAKVYGNAIVKGNASVSGNAIVCDNAIITGRARVCGNAKICNDAIVSEAARIQDDAKILDNAIVSGWSEIRDNAVISGHAIITDHPIIMDNASISDYSVVMGRTHIDGDTQVDGSILVTQLKNNKSSNDNPPIGTNAFEYWKQLRNEDNKVTCEEMKYNINNLPHIDINAMEYCKQRTSFDGYMVPKCSRDNRKYIFTGMSKIYKNYNKVGGSRSYDAEEIRLFQIQRISDGMLGGWIQSEDNLSYEGDCWVDYRVNVFGNARVHENAIVDGTGEIFGNAQVYGNTRISSIFIIQDNAKVFGNARIDCDESFMYDDTKIYDNAFIVDSIVMHSNDEVCGNTIYIDIEEEEE